jgi:hypothetical protein
MYLSTRRYDPDEDIKLIAVQFFQNCIARLEKMISTSLITEFLSFGSFDFLGLLFKLFDSMTGCLFAISSQAKSKSRTRNSVLLPTLVVNRFSKTLDAPGISQCFLNKATLFLPLLFPAISPPPARFFGRKRAFYSLVYQTVYISSSILPSL